MLVVGLGIRCCRAIEIFVGFVRAVELVLIDSLRIELWGVPLLAL